MELMLSKETDNKQIQYIVCALVKHKTGNGGRECWKVGSSHNFR